MTPENTKTSYLPVIATALLAAAVAGVVILSPGLNSGSTETPHSNSPAGPPEETGTDPQPGNDLGGWGAVTRVRKIVVDAAEADKFSGKMQLAEGEDNKNVTDASGRRASVQYVHVPNKACAKGENPADHQAVFHLTVPESGTYYPWARVWWMNSCGDSVGIKIRREDQKAVGEFEITDGTHEWWHWLALTGPEGVKLEEGSYVVVVENREDGARLSRILFTQRDYETYKPSTPEG